MSVLDQAVSGVGNVFVYGTLLPGQVRWRHLAPFVVDEGVPDAVAGRLFDTGLGYPAALFDDASSRIVGRTFVLLNASREQALARLDEIEGAVAGLYARVTVRTDAGLTAYAYEFGGGLELIPIASGDWLQR
jgi:gamma-glutamylcyclotransferase (GGCT)/AIG2-like uncharacterized protein YtfP